MAVGRKAQVRAQATKGVKYQNLSPANKQAAARLIKSGYLKVNKSGGPSLTKTGKQAAKDGKLTK